MNRKIYMIEKTLKIAVAVPCQLGESPVWDDRQHCLHFVDILSAHIYSYYPADKSVKVTTVNDPVGAIVPCQDGRFLAATSSGIYYITLPQGQQEFLLQPEPHTPNNRYNDGKVDSSGRLWIASMHLEEQEEKGAMYVVYPDLSSKKVLDNTTISNGLDWDKADNIFYHVESGDATIRRFAYDKIQVGIHDMQPIVTFQEDEGVPDGMTLDSEGMIWVAHFGGGCVTRRNPENGEVLAKIELPVKQVTSCVFGGKQMNDLYITTAAKGLTEAELAEQPEAGFTFVLEDLPYRGLKPNKFVQIV
ncbi:SMP-30/gluconolactonase/LRE family protein [Sphingobacterium sp. lm-10]|uniref:SMP-30/gluconolactonase/LRE family protein n=1 Tax=Sphingobacterium sp. lm-10 TaxID=2944904 RepID=UPI00202185EC|nr:SMP-30/gluconolactonase/LRE family protein [Sphingobacterium sp. lm-10]MCL7986929.1 SMP-30/gluconolactonase/LRE family protein [Sphingobacterium sp. lm-10]